MFRPLRSWRSEQLPYRSHTRALDQTPHFTLADSQIKPLSPTSAIEDAIMSDTRDISKLTRQELYDLVWSKPATTLAAEFGISDVAIGKRCKSQNVPKPSPGYWAKLTAGEKPTKRPLPPPPDDVFVQAAKQPVGKLLALPETAEALHPLAAELIRVLPRARLDDLKRAVLRTPTLPEVNASKVLTDRMARAFQVILKGVEHLGIMYRKSQSSYSGGFFLRRHDRLYLRIEETVTGPRGGTVRRPTWGSHPEMTQLSGYLCFVIQQDRYARDEKEWFETATHPLERVLAEIVTFIRKHFVEAHERRVQAAIQAEKQRIEWQRHQREWEAKEAIRLQQEAERKHARALESAAEARTEDLLKAAEWWRLNQTLTGFINECEQRWSTSAGVLSLEQQAWLVWARQYASTISPFSSGYPDPTQDGGFDSTSVPFGGPYPPTRDLPHPSF